MNILHITPDFNYACGRSYYVYLLLKYFSKEGNNVILVSNGGDSFDRIDELNIPCRIIKGMQSRSPVSLAKTINEIRKIISEFKIDIIHTHHRYAELLGLQAKNLVKHKISTVMTALSIVNKNYKIEYKSDKIIAVSNSVYRMLAGKFGISPGKIKLIPNFTDTDEIHEIEALNPRARGHGKFYNILAIGRFHHEKNFEVLLRSMNILNDNDIRLILLGEGDKYIDYRKYINMHKLNVEIIVPQRNLFQYFLSADLCALPSQRDPFPNFMLQSGLHRKPFIGADVDGIGELIKDGFNGLLFESGNAEMLAEKIHLFKSNVPLANRCADNLHSEVIKNYTQQSIIPKINELYKSLLN